MDTITLEKHVDSLISQLRPHLTSDVVISPEWVADMIHASRSALVPALYNGRASFEGWYQPLYLKAVKVGKMTVDGLNFTPTMETYKIVLPCNLMQGMGMKNIQYLTSLDMDGHNYSRVSMNEFLSYKYHRYGKDNPIYVTDGHVIYLRNVGSQVYYNASLCLDNPTAAPNFTWESSVYPLPGHLHRKMEIVAFQHMAPKLGMPVDLLNNALDETKNAPVQQQVKQTEQVDPDR